MGQDAERGDIGKMHQKRENAVKGSKDNPTDKQKTDMVWRAM